MTLTPKQLSIAVTAVKSHGWTWQALRILAPELGIKVPEHGCWQEVAQLDLLPAVCQVAVALQDTPRALGYLCLNGAMPEGTVLPASLKTLYLYLGGGTMPPGCVLPASLKILAMGGGTLPPGCVLPASLEVLGLGGGTLPPGCVLPASLKTLYLDGGYLPPGCVLPASLKVCT